MFSVKLCNLMTNFAKTSPSEYLIWPPHLSCLPDVSSFPNFNGCEFLDYLQLLRVLCHQNHLFKFVLHISYGGDQTHKRVFFLLLKIKRYCIPKWREEVGGGVKISTKKKCQYCYRVIFFVFFCAAKSYEFVSFTQKITLPSCDVTSVCCYFINICIII